MSVSLFSVAFMFLVICLEGVYFARRFSFEISLSFSNEFYRKVFEKECTMLSFMVEEGDVYLSDFRKLTFPMSFDEIVTCKQFR